LPGTGLLKCGTDEKIEERIDMMGIRGRRRKHLLDDLKEIRGCWKLKEEALDRTQWRTGLVRGSGPVAKKDRAMNANKIV
jgi:hypothetical protein